MTGNRLLRVILGVMFLVPLCATAFAQAYPNRPIRLVIPYSPGGVVDTVGRVLGMHLAAELGQTVVAENKPGAGGILGTDTVARERPDGYTLLIMDPAIVINPTLQTNISYDLFRQLDTLSVISSSPEVLVVAPALSVRTFEELIAYGKANPGKLNFASAGVGTTPHLAGEMFKQRTGIDATHIPYRGIASSYGDLMTNKVQFAFSSIAGALSFTTDNRVIALATTGTERSQVYPDKPTVQEAGLADFSVDLWLAVFAPVGLPADVREKLVAAIAKTVTNGELKTAFERVGVSPRQTSPQDSAIFVKAEYEKWKKIIIDGKIKEQ
jgi:tripartite-type tricarboxylate transporter receptor subunit TctC